jgi:hypothetical protein
VNFIALGSANQKKSPFLVSLMVSPIGLMMVWFFQTKFFMAFTQGIFTLTEVEEYCL